MKAMHAETAADPMQSSLFSSKNVHFQRSPVYANATFHDATRYKVATVCHETSDSMQFRTLNAAGV